MIFYVQIQQVDEGEFLYLVVQAPESPCKREVGALRRSLCFESGTLSSGQVVGNSEGGYLPKELKAQLTGDVITRPASRRPEYTVSVFTLTALGPKEAECEL